LRISSPAPSVDTTSARGAMMSVESSQEPTRADVLAIVLEAAADAVEPVPQRPPAEITESTALIGSKAVVDSLGLVQIISDVEDTISDRFGRDVDLTDESALSQEKSPFRSVGTLVDHIMADGSPGGP
jgi:acyl carrier protein